MSKNIRYVAELKNVREICVSGLADFGFWKSRLAPENLVPTNFGGKAKLLVSVIDSKFLKIPFRELIFSVFVDSPNNAKEQGIFLCHAFNTSRLFAYIERKFFSTPYYPGLIHMDLSLPASLNVVADEQMVFRARMSADAEYANRKPEESKSYSWSGQVYIPTIAGKPPKMFFAKISGQTDFYPFVDEDSITIKPHPNHPILQQLIDSNFAGTEWSMRDSAFHAKAKTTNRG